jgi:hypothetical protein
VAVKSEAGVSALGLLLSMSLVAAPAQQSSSQGAQRPRQNDSLIDFALKQINASDEDHGQQVEDFRRIVIERSIDDLLFWSTSCSLVLLLISCVVIAHQARERKHREIMAAKFLTWYHNELLQARAVANEAVKNRQMKRAIEEETATNRPPAGIERKCERAFPIALPSAGAVVSDHNRQTTSGELVLEINRLRQKVASQEGIEKILRQQIVQLGHRVQQEKQRNSTLKGG